MLEFNHESAKLETDELIQTLNGEMTNDLNRELFRYNIIATLPKEELTYSDLSVEDVLNECGVDMETMNFDVDDNSQHTRLETTEDMTKSVQDYMDADKRQ